MCPSRKEHFFFEMRVPAFLFRTMQSKEQIQQKERVVFILRCITQDVGEKSLQRLMTGHFGLALSLLPFLAPLFPATQQSSFASICKFVASAALCPILPPRQRKTTAERVSILGERSSRAPSAQWAIKMGVS